MRNQRQTQTLTEGSQSLREVILSLDISHGHCQGRGFMGASEHRDPELLRTPPRGVELGWATGGLGVPSADSVFWNLFSP